MMTTTLQTTALIMGAGQVGLACGIDLAREGKASRIVLHARTEEEAFAAVERMTTALSRSQVQIEASWGDLLVPENLSHIPRERYLADPESRHVLLDFYYGVMDDERARCSALYQLVKRVRPAIIVDAINTATIFGYEEDLYSTARAYLGKTDTTDNAAAAAQLLLASFVPKIVRFVQILHLVLRDFGVSTYVKVSTTGLGGMGLNLMYTHGDQPEPGLSSGLLGKVTAAGVLHQLLWNLAHTPGMRVSVVVPATLVGWDGVHYGPIKSSGGFVQVAEMTTRISPLSSGANYLAIPQVESGENSAYALEEMRAITAFGQMGCITKEEVAQAVTAVVSGDTRHDILRAMDAASLGPTITAVLARGRMLSNLARLEETTGVPSVASGNLGPKVAKDLFELRVLLEVEPDWHRLAHQSPQEVASAARAVVMETTHLRTQALSLGLSLALCGGELVAAHPCEDIEPRGSSEVGTRRGVALAVDLREESVTRWQQQFRRLTGTQFAEDTDGHEGRASAGALLAAVYSMDGGGRRM